MNAAKHTPAPWRVQVHYFEKLAAYLVNDGKNEPDRVTLEANERLIAAAPELLDALESLLETETWCDALSTDTVEKVVRSINPEIIETCLAAISKARGMQ